MANNSSGARSVLYGKTIDHVLEQHVVLSDGSVAHFRPLGRRELDAAVPRRHARGARATARCAGSPRDCADEIERRYPEGPAPRRRLQPRRVRRRRRAVQPREADRRLRRHARRRARGEGQPRAAAEGEGGAGDPVRRPARGARGDAGDPRAPAVGRRGDGPLHPRPHASRTPRSTACGGPSSTAIPAALLCVEFYADRAEDLPPRLDALERDLRGAAASATAITAPSTWRRRHAIWSLREAALGLSMAMKDDAKSLSFVEDTAVAPERLRDYIDALPRASSRRHGTTAGVYAHASVGCLHVRPVVNLKTDAGRRASSRRSPTTSPTSCSSSAARSRASTATAWCAARSWRRCSGRCSTTRSGRSSARSIRTALFNPGKIVDAPPLTANLRYGAGYRDAAAGRRSSTTRDYGGMGGAVEMCSGLGACRKTLDGTMCPSYMATREEAHSTRGRANVLRLAMAGRLGEAGLGDEGVREVLDLCLECRACKAECPVGVDVARFKSEFLADYWTRHGTPLRARVLGHVARAGAVGQPARAGLELRRAEARRCAGSTNGCSGSIAGARRRRGRGRPSARALRAGVDPERPPTRRCSSTTRSRTTTTRESAWRASTCCERAGCGVALAPNVCCGRPLISQGLLDEARDRARAEHRSRCIRSPTRAARFVFFEPSCLSAVREDAPELLRGEAQRQAQRGRRARACCSRNCSKRHAGRPARL